jgi:hypothetical protein
MFFHIVVKEGKKENEIKFFFLLSKISEPFCKYNLLTHTFQSTALCVQQIFNPKKFYAQII